jgi:hypothetical protein
MNRSKYPAERKMRGRINPRGGGGRTSRKTGTAFRRGQASPSPTGQTKRKETR